MPVAFWDQFDEGNEEDLSRFGPYDLLQLNGVVVPGRASVKVATKMRIDVKKATSQDGGPTIERGHEAAEIEIQILVWMRSQLEALERLMQKIWRLPGRPPVKQPGGAIVGGKAISVFHPVCTFSGITALVIESASWTGIQLNEGGTLQLKCLQYIPPVKREVTNKPSGSGQVVPLTPELAGKNSVPAATPDQTEAYAVPPVEPAEGDE